MNTAITLAKSHLLRWGAIAVAAIMLAVPMFAHAVDADGDGVEDEPVVAAQDDIFGLNPVGQNINLGERSLQGTITGVINVALSLLGIIAVVIVLIGGFKWMTAGGSDEKVGEARKLIFSGIIGLAIIMSAWAIARFVIVQLQTQTGAAPAQPAVVVE